MVSGMDEPSPSPVSIRRAVQFRAAGVVILALGLAGAGALYWARTRTPALADDPMMLSYSKPQRMQMGVMYGKMGTLIEDLGDDLAQPGTQAFLIAAGSAVAAWGCFFAARRV